MAVDYVTITVGDVAMTRCYDDHWRCYDGSWRCYDDAMLRLRDLTMVVDYFTIMVSDVAMALMV